MKISIIIAGVPDAVRDILFSLGDRSRVLFRWSTPFVLLGASEITYCVNISDSTNRRTLHSQCGLDDTNFMYTIPSKFVCTQLEFSVTPVNVVGSGLPSTTSHTITSAAHASGLINAPELVEVVYLMPPWSSW